ncbi:hypothetical protein D920_01634 [Enterococcus faecalis 13-SD-W-01]|nr:hypothetical protein D920_01634 [Enterococcus faecalis 13-SD-W-01]
MKMKNILLLNVAVALGVAFPTTSFANANQFDSPVEAQDLVNNFSENKIMEDNSMLRSSRRASFYRGSVFMWSRDNINFNISGGRVTSSSGFQETGWIFPNIVRARGLTRMSTTANTHRWRGSKTIGAGSVTPWGDVTIFNVDFNDQYGVHGNGSFTWY